MTAAKPAAPPAVIYLIRHAEKPEDPNKPPHGVDVSGRHDIHSLTPRGWQRAGALAGLFSALPGQPRPGFQTPTRLVAPSYGGRAASGHHRAAETLLPLSQKLGRRIEETREVGEEAALAADLLRAGEGAVVLVAWEHHRLVDIAANLPLAAGTKPPTTWPDDRFDVVWRFELDPAAVPPRYRFSQLTQELLSGDRRQPIAAAPAVDLDL